MRKFVLLVMGLFALPVYAMTHVNLYQSEVILTQEQGDDAAHTQGMKDVIIRASGEPAAVSNPVIKKALAQTSQYLTQISQSQQSGQSTLKMGFSEPGIRALLTQAQLPYWPAERANVLVWLVEDNGSQRSIRWENAASPLLQAMKSSARLRGLPLTVPVGDIDDITNVAVSDLWGGFMQPVSVASQRYPADAVLIVRADGSHLRWSLYDQAPAGLADSTRAPVTGSDSGADAAKAIIDQISNYYAKKNAVVVAANSSEAVKAQFIAIDGALDFFHLENKLKRLPSVASLDIVKIQNHQVTFNVHLLSSSDVFQREVLNLGMVTRLESQPVTPLVDTLAEQPVAADEPGPVTSITPEPRRVPAAVNSTKKQAQSLPPQAPILVFEWQA